MYSNYSFFFRVENNFPNPEWKEFIMDGEKTVQTVLQEFYPNVKISLCLFHMSKTLLGYIAKEHMSNYFRNCAEDIEHWTYDKIRMILCLPFLPKEEIEGEFLKIQKKILGTLKKFLNPMDLEVFEKILDQMKTNYFSNPSKIDKFCKFGIIKRTSNNMEGYHSVLNKSILFKKRSTMNTVVNGKIFLKFFYNLIKFVYIFSGLKQVDVEMRVSAIGFQKKGALSLPKHKPKFLRKEMEIMKLNQQLENKEISNEKFLSTLCELIVHKNYFEVVKLACENIDKQANMTEGDQNLIVEDATEVILSNCNSSKRVRTKSKKYFGGDWAA